MKLCFFFCPLRLFFAIALPTYTQTALCYRLTVLPLSLNIAQLSKIAQLFLIGLLCFLPLNVVSADPVRIKVEGELVNLSVDDHYDTPGNALGRLVDALNAYPTDRRFRLSFSLLVFNNTMNTTVLYDRSKHSVILYSTGNGDVLGTYCDHVRFTRVQESAFAEIAKAHRNDYNEEAWASLGDLPKYGCRQHDLGSRHTGP
jgi:hypothetical protein